MSEEQLGEEGGGAVAPEGVPEAPAPRRASCWMRLWVLVGLLAGAAGVGYLVVWSMMPVDPAAKDPVVVMIPRNSGSRDIAARLRRLNLVRNQWVFLAAGRLLGELGNLKAGEYELKRSMSPIDILDKLARGDVTAYWVTIPEGSTIDDMARILHKQQLAKPEQFTALAKRGGLRIGPKYGVPRRNLEGYLYPDTYKVPRVTNEQALIRDMVRTFEREVLKGIGPEIAARTNGLSVEDTITLASLVEREARLPEERSRIAGVLANRLRRGMRLECDATVQYALGKTKERLLYADLKIDSPYNTYRHKGLPPGPICSPGLACIRAALNPEKHAYLFYVADGEKGGHLFSRTFDEHRAAIRRVRGR